MKQRLTTMYTKLLLFFAILFCTASAQSMDTLSTYVKVMTYNIRLDFEGDGVDNWQHRKEDMVHYIQKHQPDFIGIQEALFHQLSYLDENLEDYSYIGVGRDDGKTAGEFMAIFYRTASWEVERQGTFWLSASPGIPSMGWDAACYRVCTYGLFKNKAGQSLALFNTHFDHVGIRARKESVAVLKAHMAAIPDDYPMVLTGDFNITPADTVYTLLENVMVDSRSSAAHISESSEGTFNGFKMKDFPEKRIDYIFVEAAEISVLKYLVEKPLTKSGRQLSDHFPVLVELEIVLKGD
jgi:endonuclease/exonuclease/phosphatase family metal-dependent hydrolase